MPSPKILLLTAGLLLATVVARADAPAVPPPIPNIAGDALRLELNDGPYIFYDAGKESITAAWICNGKTIQKNFAKTAGTMINPECAYTRPITLRDDKITFPVPVKFTAKKLVAFSDVHGQFETLVKQLQIHHIIDRDMKWSFGNGHMVVIGDIFDRGPGVTDALWLLYQLEAEARNAGGAVHVLLGNHETMVFHNDLRYVNPRYAAVSSQLNKTYPALFDDETVLGRWLRTKPVMVQVNDMLFVHGGLSSDYAALRLNAQATNEAFRNSLGQPREIIRAAPLTAALYGVNGPVWYRGYFRDPQMDSAALDKVIRQFGVKRIVVGHTSLSHVFTHNGGRVISVDAGMQKAGNGELLLWSAGKFSRATLQGEKLPLTEYAKGSESLD